jgi:hypothetical protein
LLLLGWPTLKYILCRDWGGGAYSLHTRNSGEFIRLIMQLNLFEPLLLPSLLLVVPDQRTNRAAPLVVIKWLTHLPFNQM